MADGAAMDEEAGVDAMDLAAMANGEVPVPVVVDIDADPVDAALDAIQRIQKRRLDDREITQGTLDAIIKRYGEDEDYRDQAVREAIDALRNIQRTELVEALSKISHGAVGRQLDALTAFMNNDTSETFAQTTFAAGDGENERTINFMRAVKEVTNERWPVLEGESLRLCAYDGVVVLSGKSDWTQYLRGTAEMRLAAKALYDGYNLCDSVDTALLGLSHVAMKKNKTLAAYEAIELHMDVFFLQASHRSPDKALGSKIKDLVFQRRGDSNQLAAKTGDWGVVPDAPDMPGLSMWGSCRSRVVYSQMVRIMESFLLADTVGGFDWESVQEQFAPHMEQVETPGGNNNTGAHMVEQWDGELAMELAAVLMRTFNGDKGRSARKDQAKLMPKIPKRNLFATDTFETQFPVDETMSEKAVHRAYIRRLVYTCLQRSWFLHSPLAVCVMSTLHKAAHAPDWAELSMLTDIERLQDELDPTQRNAITQWHTLIIDCQTGKMTQINETLQTIIEGSVDAADGVPGTDGALVAAANYGFRSHLDRLASNPNVRLGGKIIVVAGLAAVTYYLFIPAALELYNSVAPLIPAATDTTIDVAQRAAGVLVENADGALEVGSAFTQQVLAAANSPAANATVAVASGTRGAIATFAEGMTYTILNPATVASAAAAAVASQMPDVSSWSATGPAIAVVDAGAPVGTPETYVGAGFGAAQAERESRPAGASQRVTRSYKTTAEATKAVERLNAAEIAANPVFGSRSGVAATRSGETSASIGDEALTFAKAAQVGHSMKTRLSSASSPFSISTAEYEKLVRERDTGRAATKLRAAAGQQWTQAATRPSTRSTVAGASSKRPRPTTGLQAMLLGGVLDIVAPTSTLNMDSLTLAKRRPAPSANTSPSSNIDYGFAGLFPHRV